MDDRTRRMAELTPEKRALLEQLLARQSAATAERQASPPVDERITDEAVAAVDWGEGMSGMADGEAPSAMPTSTAVANKAAIRRLYNAVSQQLDEGIYGRHAMFLNYGYKDVGGVNASVVELPPRVLNRNCIRLVLELVGPCDIQGRDVLDIGCGRGGTVYVLDTYFAPRRIVGIDLSPRAIAFCHRNHRNERISYLVGDAEAPPCGAATFDVVTNVESSHNYPNMHAFYDAVYRVLRPGGYFLYTDVIRRRVLPSYLDYVAHLGFELEADRDITASVLASCDEIAAQREVIFGLQHDRDTVRYILGAPGSGVYDDLQGGRSEYRIFRVRKR